MQLVPFQLQSPRLRTPVMKILGFFSLQNGTTLVVVDYQRADGSRKLEGRVLNDLVILELKTHTLEEGEVKAEDTLRALKNPAEMIYLSDFEHMRQQYLDLALEQGLASLAWQIDAWMTLYHTDEEADARLAVEGRERVWGPLQQLGASLRGMEMRMNEKWPRQPALPDTVG